MLLELSKSVLAVSRIHPRKDAHCWKVSGFSLCYANPAGSFKRGYESSMNLSDEVGMQSGCSIDNALDLALTSH